MDALAARPVVAAAQPWLLDCGSGVRLQAWHSAPAVPISRTAVLLHGWEGSVSSCYVLSLAALLYARGYAVVRLNLRDHGRTQALNRGLFHSCRLSDVSGALGAIAARCGAQPLYLAGFSLGGNFLLRACAEPALPASVAGVVAVSPVLDPDHTLRARWSKAGPCTMTTSYTTGRARYAASNAIGPTPTTLKNCCAPRACAT